MAVFELGGALASAIPELPVGPWTRSLELPAFAADLAAPASLWRIDLTGDPAAALAALADGERSVARSHAALDDLPRRLEAAIQCAVELPASADHRPAADHRHPTADHRHPTAVATASAVAGRATYGLALSDEHRGQPLSPERAAEARLIAALVGEPAAPPRDAWIAWSGSPDTAAADEDPGRLAQLLERIVDFSRGRARIETRLEGTLVAHSLTTLSGDTELWVAPRLSIAGARLHARAVSIAVRTRHAWARILTLIVRGTSRLLALGLPTAGLAALPLVWSFVRDVLREIRGWNGPTSART
jgi:hypothetical protein